MKIVALSKVPVERHRFRTLLSRPALCAEVVASIAEAIQTTRDQMHPQLSPSAKGMHTYGHAMTNLGYATEGHGGRLMVVNGQQRLVFDQPEGLGELHVVLAKGYPTEGGFEIGGKGPATDQLIGIPQQSFDLELEGLPMDDGAFFVHCIVEDPKRKGNLEVVVYLAHPAQLNDRRNFLHCDECVLLGRRALRTTLQPALDIDEKKVEITPQIRTRA
ncbi:MAG: hypothetical protein ACO1SV_18420 [Fimbriimonas sp.]